MTRWWLTTAVALAGLAGCDQRSGGEEVANDRDSEAAMMVADTQFIVDSSGANLLIITGRTTVREFRPRKGSGDPDAPDAYRELPARTVHSLIQAARPPWYIIDVRTDDEWVGMGHLPEATLFPFEELERNIEDLHIRTDQFVLVYGRDTAHGRMAARLLAEHGFPHLRVLQGGFGAWQRAGLQIGEHP
ncbi:MAG: rhodanese-like domain-containing protein [Gemmatimonadetes bacterium]|nr:rhodanese-like domain-containing protein [Gemmatimonadota bacterium]